MKDAKLLSVRDQLRSGDRIQLGESDRVELLLNPGSYLRIAGEGQFEVYRTAFDDMKFGLPQGTAIVESSVYNKKVHALQVSTPAGDVRILESGLYRVDVRSPQAVSVSVMKGRAKWFKDQKEMAVLKSGKRFNLSMSSERNLQVAKLTNDPMDDLDLWSRRRAEFLVAANSRMSYSGREMAYMNYGYRSWGGWAYNPFYGCYTFVPFDGIFMSPYGFSYRNYLPVYAPYYFGRSGGGYHSGGSGSSSIPPSTSVQTRSSVSTAPASPSSRGDVGRSDSSSRSSVHSTLHR
jgi:hypothetical protein